MEHVMGIFLPSVPLVNLAEMVEDIKMCIVSYDRAMYLFSWDQTLLSWI